MTPSESQQQAFPAFADWLRVWRVLRVISGAYTWIVYGLFVAVLTILTCVLDVWESRGRPPEFLRSCGGCDSFLSVAWWMDREP